METRLNRPDSLTKKLCDRDAYGNQAIVTKVRLKLPVLCYTFLLFVNLDRAQNTKGAVIQIEKFAR